MLKNNVLPAAVFCCGHSAFREIGDPADENQWKIPGKGTDRRE